MPCLHMAFFCPFLLCWSCLTWTTQRASPCSQFSTFLRDLLARINLCIAASRASGLAANWYWLYYDEAQSAVFCTFQILYLIWYSYTMHAWIQLAVALAYVLMYYYGNTASSIRRDLTASLSFIIISVWLFGEPKCSEILS